MNFAARPELAAVPLSVMGALETLLANLAGQFDEGLLIKILIAGVLRGDGPLEYLTAIKDQLDQIMASAPAWERKAAGLFLTWAIGHLTPAVQAAIRMAAPLD